MEITNKPWVILADPNNSDYIREYIKVKGFGFCQASFCFGDFFSEDGKSLGNDYRYIENAGYKIIQTSELRKIISDMKKTSQSDPFTLPKNWHVVVTEENQKEVSEWRFKTSEKICLGFIAGVVYKVPQDRYEKGHNPGDLIKKPDYDFGQEITTEQFRKYVLKKEEKKFPRLMLVSDDTNNWIRKTVHCYCGTLKRPWVVEVGGYKYAKEIPAPQPIYLTAQDISEGKGVGVDPKLIKFKE